MSWSVRSDIAEQKISMGIDEIFGRLVHKNLFCVGCDSKLGLYINLILGVIGDRKILTPSHINTEIGRLLIPEEHKLLGKVL